jgi:hypothetical protein
MTREAGFDYHLTKPVDREELERLLLVGVPHAHAQPATPAQQRH